MRMQKTIAAAALMLLIAATGSSHAQMGGGGRRQHDQPQTSTKSSVPSGPVIIPQVWPRLDEGAVLCKSRDDLVKYQHQLADAAGSTPQAMGCRTILKQTGIQILDHDGPSRTQVVTTDDAKETGWTDTYLPATPPASIAQHATTAK